MPRARIFKKNKDDKDWTVRVTKKCFISNKDYYVDLPIDNYRQMKITGSPDYSKLTRNQRRFLVSFITPKEFEALKHDRI